MASSALLPPLGSIAAPYGRADQHLFAHAGPSRQADDKVATPSPAKRSRKSYLCPFADCGKSFGKECKLDDHLRTHTGERPFRCDQPGCTKDFRRKDHLQRHQRSHLFASAAGESIHAEQARPFQCTVKSKKRGRCTRRFASRDHLVRHVCEVHDGESTAYETSDGERALRPTHKRRAARPGSYRCTIGGCESTFTKRKRLRAHINVYHSDKSKDLSVFDKEEAARVARLPFPCTFEGCTKRYSTHGKRQQHIGQRHSERKRYLCTQDHAADSTPVFFATWSELQAHHRIEHKPTCPIVACAKVFKSARNLRLHLRHVHGFEDEADDDTDDGEALEEEEDANDNDDDARMNSLLPYGCDWLADAETGRRCERRFYSKYNRDVHLRNVHQGVRAFKCPREGCSRSFSTKRAAVRHGHSCGQSPSTLSDDDVHVESSTSDDDDGDDFFRREGGAVPESFADRPRARKRARTHGEQRRLRARKASSTSAINMLVGGYANEDDAGAKRRARGRVLKCPWKRICALRDMKTAAFADEDGSEQGQSSDTEMAGCAYRFSRLYDVQRHLQAHHNLSLTQLDIRAMLDEKEQAALGAPRKGTKVDIESRKQLQFDSEEEEEEEEEEE